MISAACSLVPGYMPGREEETNSWAYVSRSSGSIILALIVVWLHNPGRAASRDSPVRESLIYTIFFHWPPVLAPVEPCPKCIHWMLGIYARSTQPLHRMRGYVSLNPHSLFNIVNDGQPTSLAGRRDYQPTITGQN